MKPALQQLSHHYFESNISDGSVYTLSWLLVLLRML